MKSVLHKSVSFAMAVLLLLSTTSWKVEKHYCMGRLMNIALFVDVDDCGMDMSSAGIEENSGATTDSCCDDEVIYIDGQDDLKIALNDLNTDKGFHFITTTYSSYNLSQVLQEQGMLFEQYPPPILVRDIQLLDQVFLI